MTINGSTNNSGWTYKLEVTETATSVANRTSTIQVKTYIGRANSQSYLGGNYSNSVSVTGASSQTQSGTISPYPTYINGGSWLQLKTFTFTVPNTGTPTTISISSTMSSGDFTPSYASASGSMQLTILHLDPTIEMAEIEETNATMLSLNIPDTTIVQYLSQKKITLHATAYDDATLTYRLRCPGYPYDSGYQASNIFNVDFRQIDVGIANNRAYITQMFLDSMGGDSSGYLRVLIDNESHNPDAIPYVKPNLEKTTTSIKRKSGTYSSTLGRVANLTDNIADLVLTGTIYKNNDIIGNNNSITTAGYKIWERGTTEPANYTSISVSVDNDGNVTPTNDIEISNVEFDKVYNYKIMIADSYTGSDNNYYNYIIEDTIPLGQPTWTEYRDRVDFIKLTVGGYNPFEYSENETICGIWNDGIDDYTLYRKVIDIGSLPNASTTTTSHNITNLGMIVSIKGVAIRSSDKDTLPIPYVTFNANNSGGIVAYANSSNVVVTTSSNRSAYDGYVVLEYTKSS